MQMLQIAPHASLAPFVRTFTVVESDAEATRLLLPEAGLVLAFRYRGSATLLKSDGTQRLASASLTGMQSTARRMKTEAGGILVVQLHAVGAAQFFSMPMDVLQGHTTALDSFVPRSAIDRLTDQISSASSTALRISWVEQFLLSRLSPKQPDPMVNAAVQAIRASHGTIRIQALARALSISQDPLEKRFRRIVGTSPKRYAALVRLRHAVSSYRPGMSLALLAHDAGYFDQSHFIRDFRAVTGLSPGAYFEKEARW